MYKRKMDLNTKLINLKNLYCPECKFFLYPPIMLSPTTKNICGICYEERDNKDGYVQNEALEDVIKFLEVPCRYSTEGCKDLFNQQQLLEHERKCNFKPTKCPISEDCWSGCFMQLKRHLVMNHKDSTTTSDNLSFEFIVNIDNQYNMHRLLLWNTELFLLKLNVLLNFIQLSICHTDCDINDKLQFKVEEVDNIKGFYQKLGIVNKIHAYNAKCEKIDINLTDFKKLNIDLLNIKVKIYFGNEPPNIDSKNLKLLECPVCLEYMSKEIYICTTGHSICNRCKFKVQECPTCKSKIENGRNFVLQSLYDDTNIPCFNRSFGCTIVAPGAELNQHFRTCKFAQLFCQFQDCAFRGKYYDVVDHYNNIHHVDNNQFTVRYPGKHERMDGFVILVDDGYWGRPISAYGHIFTVESSTHGNELNLNIYSLIDITSEFQVVITFGHERKNIIFNTTFHDFHGTYVKIPLDYFTDLTDIYCTVRIMKLDEKQYKYTVT